MDKKSYKKRTGRVNLEVKPRRYNDLGPRNYSYEQKDFTSGNATMIKIVISIFIIITVFMLKKVNIELTNNITENIKKGISYQVQWNELFKSDIISNFESQISSIFGKDTAVFNDGNTEFDFIVPVEGHLSSNFDEKIHPVFNTKIEPRGIELTVFKTQSVFASETGVVLNIITSTYQGKRIIIQHNDTVKTVYDGVEDCKVKEGETINKGSILGTISANDESSKLFFFEMWNDNVAVDPLNYVKIDGNNTLMQP